MKKATWRKQHKWLGIILCFFVIMFCLSGIVLNHRPTFSDLNVGRKWLPDRYRYAGWNGGLLRGTVPVTERDSSRSVLIYGTGGIWKTDSIASRFEDFNKGLPTGADFRQIRNVACTPANQLYAVSIFGLYRYSGDSIGWQAVTLPKDGDELLTDITCHGDTMIVASRSYLYRSVAPYTGFERIQLKQPSEYSGKVSLFRTVWLLHSGALFGMPGRIVVDIIAVVLIALCVTGIMYWLLPKYVRRKHRKGTGTPNASGTMRWSGLWHDRLGRYTIILTVLLTLTGWCLRPPVLIPLALNKVSPVPGTVIDSPNPWNDKIRMFRYDEAYGDWLLSTSEGFYSLRKLTDTPVRLEHTPSVSVMGLNVFQKDPMGRWLCGSFSGMFVWDRQNQTVTDYFTHEPAFEKTGPPFGKKAVSGYSADFAVNGNPVGSIDPIEYGDSVGNGFAVEYYNGTDAIPQPSEYAALPMSLWNVALEVHNGRIYMGSVATYIFVFILGLAILWCLWSGWKLRRRYHQNRHNRASL